LDALHPKFPHWRKAGLRALSGNAERPLDGRPADWAEATRHRRSRKEGCMKKIEAIIQPGKLDAVKDALLAMGIDGMTVSEVRGHGRQKGHTEVYRGHEYTVDLLPKVKIEIVVPSARLDEIVRAMVQAARSGKIGDGKIFVFDVGDAVRIRNDDRGEAAL
jgi:nitrogen regulatory protein P-II 1